ncbi:hypothetical protein [Aliidiomarina celeris]|uniref:hypothetical protein n=1 Tax=Aliidiomarina celeris TaxID=2249428 RepID=UPI0013009B85|nr:hypothetical protein [Aliidiomarina celeris]
MQLRSFSFAMGLLLINGCTSIKDISDESPYRETIGQCYVLQQDMQIWENSAGCWEIGDLILSPHTSHYCATKSKADIPKGTEITIIEVKERWQWGAGACAQLVLAIPGIDIPGRNVSPPVCFSRPSLNWNEELVWFRGDEIQLKKEYVKPCESTPERSSY